MSAVLLNQIGLVLGFLGAIALAFSNKKGVIGQGGTMYFYDMDPMDPNNKDKVIASHRLSRILTPLGWSMIALAFLVQLAATLNYFAQPSAA